MLDKLSVFSIKPKQASAVYRGFPVEALARGAGQGGDGGEAVEGEPGRAEDHQDDCPDHQVPEDQGQEDGRHHQGVGRQEDEEAGQAPGVGHLDLLEHYDPHLSVLWPKIALGKEVVLEPVLLPELVHQPVGGGVHALGHGGDWEPPDGHAALGGEAQQDGGEGEGHGVFLCHQGDVVHRLHPAPVHQRGEEGEPLSPEGGGEGGGPGEEVVVEGLHPLLLTVGQAGLLLPWRQPGALGAGGDQVTRVEPSTPQGREGARQVTDRRT